MEVGYHHLLGGREVATRVPAWLVSLFVLFKCGGGGKFFVTGSAEEESWLLNRM